MLCVASDWRLWSTCHLSLFGCCPALLSPPPPSPPVSLFSAFLLHSSLALWTTLSSCSFPTAHPLSTAPRPAWGRMTSRPTARASGTCALHSSLMGGSPWAFRLGPVPTPAAMPEPTLLRGLASSAGGWGERSGRTSNAAVSCHPGSCLYGRLQGCRGAVTHATMQCAKPCCSSHYLPSLAQPQLMTVRFGVRTCTWLACICRRPLSRASGPLLQHSRERCDTKGQPLQHPWLQRLRPILSTPAAMDRAATS